MNRGKVMQALDRFKVRTLRVRDTTRWAVFDGRTQVTNAGNYDPTLKRQRELTADAIVALFTGPGE